MTDSELQERLKTAQALVKLFAAERVSYLAVSLISIVVLFVVLASEFAKGHLAMTEMTLLFGSSGLITVSSGRVIHMFNQVMKAVFRESPGDTA